jgi:hypothetical protein
MNQIQTEPANEQALFNKNLREKDRQMLQDVTHRLLAHGSLLRSRGAERPLYDWSIEHQPWLEEWANLLGLKIIIQRDERLIMAIPEVPSLTRKLKRDETLVALALWYDFDVEVRENGAHDVYFNLRDFNEQFQSKFPSMQPLSQSRMKEILRLFSRFNLIEMDWEDEFTDSTIQILPTLRFAIPFPGIEQWIKVASTFNAAPTEEDQEAEASLDAADPVSNETPTSVAEPETPEVQVSHEVSQEEPEEEKGILDFEDEEGSNE